MALSFRNIVMKRRMASSVWIALLLASAMLLLLPLLVKFDGKTHADWQQFLGRFHPLVVHIPIGLILLVPLLEIAGLFRPALREAAGFVLSLSILGCLCAVTLGFLLAYGSGDAGAGVTRHMWGGICLSIGVIACFLTRPSWLTGQIRGVYPALLTGILLLLAWTAHQGGSLTYGPNYLTEYLPAPLKRLASVHAVQAKTSAASDSVYAMHIYPILDANCIACHGDAKVKGGLRVNSYELLMRGGKEGAVIVAGHPEKSILFERVTLPTDHKKFMPAEGKPPLKPQEIALIKAWILQGASPTSTTLVGIVFPDTHKQAPLPQVGDYSGMKAEIAQMDQAGGVMLMPMSRNPGDGLILNTASVAGNFNDAQLAQLQKFAPFIVEAELGRTGVTNACFDTLSKFTHLRALHLEGTSVTGEGLAKIAKLPELTYLNLSGTRVTQSAIAPLISMKNLQHIYLYNTPAQPISRSSP